MAAAPVGAAAGESGAAAGGRLPCLVSPEWLAANLGGVKVLDASWYLPAQGRDAAAEFAAARLPGARFFDLDGVADAATPLPHMLPPAPAFAAAADALGVGNGDALVVYDRVGLFSSPRAWWTWRAFGHERVAVLDGGLPGWVAAGGGLDESPAAEAAARAGADACRAAQAHLARAAAGTGPPPPPPRYRAKLDRAAVRSAAQLLDNLVHRREQVVDARPAARWRGAAPEPRPGLRRGHVPGSANVPWDAVQAGGRLLPPAQLAAVLREAGVDPRAPVVATCGSGTTACVLALALARLAEDGGGLGGGAVAVYDGSWAEWGDPARALPVATAAGADD